MEVDHAVKKKKKRDRDLEDPEGGQGTRSPKHKKRKKDKHKAEEEEQVVPNIVEAEVVGKEKRVKKKKKHRQVEEGPEDVKAHPSLVLTSLSETEVVGEEKRVKKKKKHRQVDEEFKDIDAHQSLVVPSLSEAEVVGEETKVKKKKKYRKVEEEMDDLDLYLNSSLSEAEVVGEVERVKKKKHRKLKEELTDVDNQPSLVVPSPSEAEVVKGEERVKKKKKKKHRQVAEELEDADARQFGVSLLVVEAEVVEDEEKVKKKKKQKKSMEKPTKVEDESYNEELNDAEAHQGVVLEDQASKSYEDLEIPHKKRKKKHKKLEDPIPTADVVIPEVEGKKKKCKDSESLTEVEVASAAVENLLSNDENLDPEHSGLGKKKKKKKSRDRDAQVTASPAPETEDEEPPRKKKKKKTYKSQEYIPLLDQPDDTFGNNNEAPKGKKKMKRLYSGSGVPVLFEQTQEQVEGPLTVFSPHKEFVPGGLKRDLELEDEDVDDPLTLSLPESIGLDASYSQEDTEQDISQTDCETGGVKADEDMSDEDMSDDEPLVKPKLKKVKKVRPVAEEVEEDSPKKKKKKKKRRQKTDEEQNSIENLLKAAVKKARSKPPAKLETKPDTREGKKEEVKVREGKKEDSGPWRAVPRVKRSVGITRLYVLPDRKVVGPELHSLCQHILSSNLLVSPLNQEYMEVSFKKLEAFSPGQGLRGQLEERYQMRVGKWVEEEDARILERYHELLDSGKVTDDEEMVTLLNSQKGKVSGHRDQTSRNIVGLYVGQDLPHRAAYELSQRLLEKLSGFSIRTFHKVRNAAKKAEKSQSEPEPRARATRWSLDEDYSLMDLVLKQPSGAYRPVTELNEKRDVDWEVIAEDFPRKWNNIRDRWMRYVRPVLFDPESAELEPEEIAQFEIDLLAAVIKTGVKTKKEIIWPLVQKKFPTRAVAYLQNTLANLTRVDYSGTGDFQKQMQQTVDKLEARECQGNNARGYNTKTKEHCLKRKSARNIDLLNHYRTLLARRR